jgi:hypothetical protein
MRYRYTDCWKPALKRYLQLLLKNMCEADSVVEVFLNSPRVLKPQSINSNTFDMKIHEKSIEMRSLYILLVDSEMGNFEFLGHFKTHGIML